MTDVLFVGVVPPPHTGMTIATRLSLEVAEQHNRVRRFEISRPKWIRSLFLWRVLKGVASVVGLPVIVAARLRGCKVLYLVPNAGLGLFYTWIHALCGSALGLRVILHHHVWSYCDRRSYMMSLLAGVVAKGGGNVFLCESMLRAFREMYGDMGRGWVVPNAIAGWGSETASISWDRPLGEMITLGHMSNLTLEKGIDVVLDTFCAVRSAGVECRLRVAGPLGPGVRELLRRYEGPDVEYIGPVYGIDKWRFLESLDVFLFPSRYRNEAYPLVCAEAMLAGAEVLATRRGCLPDLLPHAVLFSEEGFEAAARDWLLTFRSRRTPEARTRIRNAGMRFLEEAESRLHGFWADIAQV